MKRELNIIKNYKYKNNDDTKENLIKIKDNTNKIK